MDIKKLYYFPLAGASSLTLKKIKSYFPHNVEAVCFDYPGHGKRIGENNADSLNAMAEDAYNRIINDVAADTEYYLAGHCIGAVIAYDICRRLTDNGMALPARLIVSGHGIPSEIVPEGLGAMDDDTLIAYLVEKGLTDRSMADPVYRKMVKAMIIDPVRTDSALYDGYVFDMSGNKKIDCGIDVLYGKEDTRFPETKLKAWSEYTSRDVRFKGFEGGHYFLIEKEKEYFTAISDIIAKGGI
jgi:surfactin synthase thioesterase subunit